MWKEKEAQAMHIEIPGHPVVTLKAIAAARGLTLNAWLGKLAEEATEAPVRKPLKTGRACFPNIGQRRLPKRSMTTAKRCSETSPRVFDDRGRSRYSYRDPVSR
jgi:hypothetical protein